MFVFIDACCSTFGWEARRQQLPHPPRPPPPPPLLTHPFRVSQAAAAARIVGNRDVFRAASIGNIELVKDHVVADAGCVLKADSRYVCLFLALALPQPMQFCSIFLISVISGWTALILSSSSGHLDVTRFLVESGANLEAKDIKYYTLKHDFSNRAQRCISVQFF
jgi:hypothetical protein